MKLASFLVNDQERFGFVYEYAQNNETYIIEPGLAEQVIYEFSVSKTSGYQFSVPCFLEKKPWPVTMKAFLELEEEGMLAFINWKRL